MRILDYWGNPKYRLEPMKVKRMRKKPSHAVNYTMGKQIKTIAEFEKCVENNTLLFVSVWRRTTHPSILASMQYRVATNFVKNGFVYKALKIKKESK